MIRFADFMQYFVHKLRMFLASVASLYGLLISCNGSCVGYLWIWFCRRVCKQKAVIVKR